MGTVIYLDQTAIVRERLSEAEQIVIGSLLISPDSLAVVDPIVTAEDFSQVNLRLIFKTIESLIALFSTAVSSLGRGYRCRCGEQAARIGQNGSRVITPGT